jgi:hypothetical protein
MSIFMCNDHSNDDDGKAEYNDDFNDYSLDNNYVNDNDDECKIFNF